MGLGHLSAVQLKHVQGTQRGYYAGFDGEGKAAVIKHDGFKVTRLATVPFDWSLDREYELVFEITGEQMKLQIDGQDVISARDGDFAYGMTGYALYASGRAELGDMMVEEI